MKERWHLCRTSCEHGTCSSDGSCVCFSCFTGPSCDLYSEYTTCHVARHSHSVVYE